MKFIFATLILAAVAQARPRFIVIPIEDVDFQFAPEYVHHRVARSAWPQEAAPKPMPVRRQPGPPRPRPVMVEIEESESAPAPTYYADRRADGPAPGFAIPASIRTAEEQIAAGSGPSPAIAGADAVDYGAYTGGYGAFGWYSDHANFVGADAKGRR